MKRLTAFLIFALSSTTHSADVRISGVVYRSFSISLGEEVSLKSNGDMIVEVESRKGAIKRHYFDENTHESYGANAIRKVTIYAP